jgi:hypothetical protein
LYKVVNYYVRNVVVAWNNSVGIFAESEGSSPDVGDVGAGNSPDVNL